MLPSSSAPSPSRSRRNSTPNLANRYPQADAQTAHVQSRNVALTGGQAVAIRDESYIDRASQSFGGGY